MRKLFFVFDKLEEAVQNKRIPLHVFYARVYLLLLVLEFSFLCGAISSISLINNFTIFSVLFALVSACICLMGVVKMRSKESYVGSLKFKGPLAVLNGFTWFIGGLIGFVLFLWFAFFGP
ncbi:MAG: hypothetical protein HUU38_20935 [Anaerolineales bacterium]|nr:hypothetical protein [Anaerolineales bacterium]